MNKINKLAVSDADMLQSKTIDFLRFPLIVAVVMIHSTLSEVVVQKENMLDTSHLELYPIISYTLSSLLSSVAVPLFLLISGFLFFHTPPQFNSCVYVTKLKKRAKSILFPYLFWSLLVLMVIYLSQVLFPQFISGANRPIHSFSPLDYIASLWSMSLVEPQQLPYPICYQFWFLRDLMVAMIASPLIYLFIKRLGLLFVAFLMILWILNVPYPVGINPVVFAFFSIGAYISITHQNLVQITQKGSKLAVLLFIISGAVRYIIGSDEIGHLLYCVAVISGSYAAISLTASRIERGVFMVNSFLSSSSFFIFAYHGLVVVILKKLLLKLLSPQLDIAITGVYLLSPIITIISGLAVYYCLKSVAPRFTSLIVGGR